MSLFNTPSSVLNQVRAEVRGMSAYPVPDATGFIKLDAMENPYTLPEVLRVKLAERLSEVALNRYPVPSYTALKSALRTYAKVPDGFEVMLGNGSDELIQILSQAISTPQSEKPASVLAPAPAFVMYRISALFNHVTYHEVPLRKTDGAFELDAAAMIAAIQAHQPAVVYLPFPNNPTGAQFAHDDMVAVIEAVRQAHAIVVVDEAYQPFADETWMEQLHAFDHLLVMRTVSKLGLAGVRLGYMVGRADLIHELDKVRPPYNVNVLTEAAALFMLEHADVLDAQAAQIRNTRSALVAALAAMPALKVYRTHTNFVLVELLGYDAAEVFAALKERNILIKNMSSAHAQLHNCLRLTVGSERENAALITALQEILAS